MKVTAPERVFLVALGEWVEGDITVPDDVGAQLVAQGWKQPKAAPAAKKPAAAEQED